MYRGQVPPDSSAPAGKLSARYICSQPSVVIGRVSCPNDTNEIFYSKLSGVSTMSAGGSFGGNRGLRPVPPEKGVFPLDHMHLCDVEKKEYLNCLKSSGHQSEKCRHLSKKYLQCRMEKNLMAKQDLAELGFEALNQAEVSGGKLEQF